MTKITDKETENKLKEYVDCLIISKEDKTLQLPEAKNYKIYQSNQSNQKVGFGENGSFKELNFI